MRRRGQAKPRRLGWGCRNGSVQRARRFLVVFATNDVVPHVVARETHQWSQEILFATLKRPCNSISTKQTQLTAPSLSAHGRDKSEWLT
jgi:hypothetical protein